MRACTVIPGKPDSASVQDVPELDDSYGSILVDGLLVGVCGTDVEITREGYGWPPPGSDRLTLFHESLGRVREAPSGSGFAAGDLVAGIVRRPDPVPCEPCSHGQWDFCRNGQYTERGIKQRAGYGSERWRIEPEYAIKLDASVGDLGVLTEPTSVVAKAWDQADKVSARVESTPKVALVTGAGPIGLLAAMIGVQRGLDVHVIDRMTDGLKPELVRSLGGTYHSGSVLDMGVRPDVVIECTGVGQLVFDITKVVAADGVICLTGISSGQREIPAAADVINKTMVLENVAIVGSVNAGRSHWEMAAAALAKAKTEWLSQLVTRRVPMEQWTSAFDRQPEDVKVVVQVGQ